MFGIVILLSSAVETSEGPFPSACMVKLLSFVTFTTFLKIANYQRYFQSVTLALPSITAFPVPTNFTLQAKNL